MSDEKITPQAYLFGISVVDIGEARVRRGKTYRESRCCDHRKLIYDQEERRVWCESCEKDVDGFDAFLVVIGQFAAWQKQYNANVERFNELKEKHAHRIAAKNLEAEWMKKRTIPCCPHCKHGLLASDFEGRINTASKELETQRRKKVTE